MKATPTFELYGATLDNAQGLSYQVLLVVLEADKKMLKGTIIRGRIRSTLKVEDLDPPTVGDSDSDLTKDYFILVKPSIFSDLESDSGEPGDGVFNVEREIRYASSEVIVWIVRDASDEDDLVERDDFARVMYVPDLAEVELYAADNKFRTFFTLWSYDSNDRFQTGGDRINVGEFEKLWEQVAGIEDIRVILYTSRAGFFAINP